MKKVNNFIQNGFIVIVFLLVLLWSYTAFSKLADLTEFKRQLHNQNFEKYLTSLLLWLLPTVEIITVSLLLIQKTRLIGLVLSSFLMFLFTVYIALVLMNYYASIPCSCGGVLKNLGWQNHFYFNIFFLLISILGVIVQYKTFKNGGTVTK